MLIISSFTRCYSAEKPCRTGYSLSWTRMLSVFVSLILAWPFGISTRCEVSHIAGFCHYQPIQSDYLCKEAVLYMAGVCQEDCTFLTSVLWALGKRKSLLNSAVLNRDIYRSKTYGKTPFLSLVTSISAHIVSRCKNTKKSLILFFYTLSFNLFYFLFPQRGNIFSPVRENLFPS